jgi:rfaE bifunctional protein kinase chain/domain
MIKEERLKGLLSGFEKQRLLVLGDLMLDRYVAGTVDRISPEAPVPVVRVTKEQCLPGGAANVAMNVCSLGGQAIVAGYIGLDKDGEELVNQLAELGVSTDGVLRAKSLATTVKTRILAERQQIVRVDHEEPAGRLKEIIPEFCDGLKGVADGITGIIIEDYGKGMVTQEVVDTVMKIGSGQGIPVGLDPKDNHDLKISGITLATPNFKEACVAAGLHESVFNGAADLYPVLKEVGAVLVNKWKPSLLIITLGPHGMYLQGSGEEGKVIPTRAREVFDVCGAGDTVIAAAFLSLAAGATHDEASIIANCAAGVVVGKVGAASCSPRELMESMA